MCIVKGCTDKNPESILCRRHLYALNKYNLNHPGARITAEEFIGRNGRHRTKRQRDTCAIFGCINTLSAGSICGYHLNIISQFEKKFPGVQVDLRSYIRTGVLREKS
jgi:hypothetical protein